MAKGQKKSSKEIRKPKKDKAKVETVAVAFAKGISPVGAIKKS
jgi:hypothetical protein